MKYKAHIQVMPHKVLLDPQGKTVTKNLKHIGLEGLTNVRIGKSIEMEVDAIDSASADTLVKSACEKLLTNPIMEYFEFTLTESH